MDKRREEGIRDDGDDDEVVVVVGLLNCKGRERERERK
jgi:hypothetical protein